MVSKARLDLPEPESPVPTMRRSRGISSEMFWRLCTRAPCTAIVVRAVALGACLPFRFAAARVVMPWFPQGKECQLLDVDVALLGEVDRGRGLADESLVGQVLAGGGHAAD